jgi:hypothetical protein
MPFRKVGGYDQSQISLPQDGPVEKTNDSSTQSSGFDSIADAIEHPVIGDFGTLGDVHFGGSAPADVPQSSTDSKTNKPRVPSLGGDGFDDFVSEGFDLHAALGAFQHPEPPSNNDPISADRSSLNQFVRNGFSVSNLPEKFGESKLVESLITPSNNQRSVDSISISAYSDQQMVEDLLNQIKGLLLSVPQDQQSYWQNQFDELSKKFFYQANASDSFGNINLNNIVYYPLPTDQINWEAALPEFNAFLEQVQAAQQPTQVNAAGDPPPEG